ncbi:VOC family protein [Aliifodinibius sp. S!AR15-10]|uniref:VOC family protein n=1 Tax=Aliifodinibius sp. S!AR15-10 TaxID=2950437 RepID=UPI00285D1CF3|nr:VOC family protein [Aliifodinibius sp. S!AR15-10]MDR8394359.1 VOC family protein [Aliifodinibius sp. S!AR15-10]
MEQRLTLVTLGVEDMQKMRSFYEEKFGWIAEEESNDEVTFFKLNGVLFGLFGREALAEDADVDSKGEGFRSFALAHNLRSDAEVDKLFRELKEKGVTIEKAPEKTFWGGYSGYIADPEGNLWEIAHNPFMEYDELGNVL